jgi:hypothetical protein
MIYRINLLRPLLCVALVALGVAQIKPVFGVAVTRAQFQSTLEKVTTPKKEALPRDIREMRMRRLLRSGKGILMLLFLQEQLQMDSKHVSMLVRRRGSKDFVVDLEETERSPVKSLSYQSGNVAYLSTYYRFIELEEGNYEFLVKGGLDVLEFKTDIRAGKVTVLTHVWDAQRIFRFRPSFIAFYEVQIRRYLFGYKDHIYKVERRQAGEATHRIVVHLELDYEQDIIGKLRPLISLEKASLGHRRQTVFSDSIAYLDSSAQAGYYGLSDQSFHEVIFHLEIPEAEAPLCYNLVLTGQTAFKDRKNLSMNPRHEKVRMQGNRLICLQSGRKAPSQEFNVLGRQVSPNHWVLETVTGDSP